MWPCACLPQAWHCLGHFCTISRSHLILQQLVNWVSSSSHPKRDTNNSDLPKIPGYVSSPCLGLQAACSPRSALGLSWQNESDPLRYAGFLAAEPGLEPQPSSSNSRNFSFTLTCPKLRISRFLPQLHEDAHLHYIPLHVSIWDLGRIGMGFPLF